MTGYDRRRLPARPDLAAAHLRGQVEAARYVEPVIHRIATSLAPLTPRPDADAGVDTTLLHGEVFAVYDQQGGWAWGQAANDGYVGWVPQHMLARGETLPTHRVISSASHVYETASIKRRPLGWLPMGAVVVVSHTEGEFAHVPGGFVPLVHLAPLDHFASDPVDVALKLLHVPYLWGGKSAQGIDCSALVQLAHQQCGIAAPRDSDMQAAELGQPLDGALARGDLVFWKGHVGMMFDAQTLLHANAGAMAVVLEPLAEAISRIRAKGGGEITARRRVTRMG